MFSILGSSHLKEWITRKQNRIIYSNPHLLPPELKGFFGVFLTSALWDCSCTVHKVFPARKQIIFNLMSAFRSMFLNNQPICLWTSEYPLSPVFKLQFLFIFLLLVQIFHYCLKNRNCIWTPQVMIYWLHKKNSPHSSRLFFSCLHSEVGAFALSDSAAICPGPREFLLKIE